MWRSPRMMKAGREGDTWGLLDFSLCLGVYFMHSGWGTALLPSIQPPDLLGLAHRVTSPNSWAFAQKFQLAMGKHLWQAWEMGVRQVSVCGFWANLWTGGGPRRDGGEQVWLREPASVIAGSWSQRGSSPLVAWFCRVTLGIIPEGSAGGGFLQHPPNSISHSA